MNTVFSKTYITNSPEETFELGKKYGEGIEKGEAILMFGEAGAGKTVFTKGLATALDIKERITSPTFALRNDYEGKFALHHLDMYRVEDESEIYESGALEDIFGDNDVAVIEWAENIDGFVDFPHTEITVKYDGESKRTVEIVKKA